MDNFKHIGTGHQFSPWRSARKPKLRKPEIAVYDVRALWHFVNVRELLGGGTRELGSLARTATASNFTADRANDLTDFRSLSKRSPGCSCTIDGKAVACGEDGIANFNRIRYRRHDATVFLYAFDLIELAGDELRNSGSKASCRSGRNSRYRSGRSRDWFKSKKPARRSEAGSGRGLGRMVRKAETLSPVTRATSVATAAAICSSITARAGAITARY
jgi:hypothetical protein